jgi:hypothetical protein
LSRPGRPRTSRLEIWAYSRTNPFNPLPGFGFRFVSRLECRLAKLYWRWQDDRAAKRNTISSWHLVPNEKMHETGQAQETGHSQKTGQAREIA